MAQENARQALGRQLLENIKQESLFDLVRELKQPPWRSEPRRCLLSIKQIDAILHPLLLQESSSSENKTFGQPVLELTSPYSGDGKTSLLYYISSRAVLPQWLGGLDSAVVFIDTDARFDANRLYDVMMGFAVTSASLNDRDKSHLDDDGVIRRAMQHVHVFRPSSSAELLATLLDLPCYLLDVAKHVSGDRGIHSIMLDSASAFYYEDQEAASFRQRHAGDTDTINQEQNDTPPAAATATGRPSGADITAALRNLQETFDCPIIFTTWGLNPHLQTSQLSSTTDANNIHKSIVFVPYLPAPWPSFPTCRLILQRENVKPFPRDILYARSSTPGTMGEEDVNPVFARAMAEAPARHEALQQGRFVAWLDLSSCSRSGTQLQQQANSNSSSNSNSNGNTVLEFFVTRSGIRLEGS